MRCISFIARKIAVIKLVNISADFKASMVSFL